MFGAAHRNDQRLRESTLQLDDGVVVVAVADVGMVVDDLFRLDAVACVEAPLNARTRALLHTRWEALHLIGALADAKVPCRGETRVRRRRCYAGGGLVPKGASSKPIEPPNRKLCERQGVVRKVVLMI